MRESYTSGSMRGLRERTAMWRACVLLYGERLPTRIHATSRRRAAGASPTALFPMPDCLGETWRRRDSPPAMIVVRIIQIGVLARFGAHNPRRTGCHIPSQDMCATSCPVCETDS